MARRVTEVLRGIDASGLSYKKALTYAAVRAAIVGDVCRGDGEGTVGGSSEVMALEQLLAAVRAGAGLAARPSVPQALSLLRGRGRADLANGFRKAARRRNVAAHPVCISPEAVLAAFEGEPPAVYSLGVDDPPTEEDSRASDEFLTVAITEEATKADEPGEAEATGGQVLAEAEVGQPECPCAGGAGGSLSRTACRTSTLQPVKARGTRGRCSTSSSGASRRGRRQQSRLCSV